MNWWKTRGQNDMTERTFPCLSIRQPWVWAIFFAGKPVENRDWPTKVRGRVLIHASAGMTRREYSDFADCWMNGDYGPRQARELPHYENLPRGCLFGGITIADCVDSHPSPWFFGRYGFVLTNPRPLPHPVPYKGRLGFFDVPASALDLANPRPE